jgi:hypothetical protein
MFGLDFYIDTFQSTKRMLTDNVIVDKTLNKAANDFITSQTQFAKMLAHNYVDITKYSIDKLSKVYFPEKEVTVAEAKATTE